MTLAASRPHASRGQPVRATYRLDARGRQGFARRLAGHP